MFKKNKKIKNSWTGNHVLKHSSQTGKKKSFHHPSYIVIVIVDIAIQHTLNKENNLIIYETII